MRGEINFEAASGGEESPGRWFKAGVRLAVREGGCCASRAAYVGACLGGLLGPEAVADDWLERFSMQAEVREWAEAICATRD